MRQQHATDSFWGGIIKSMGLVFGDIGTSPIYTLTVIFAITKPTQDNVFGILSLIVWTLIILVTVEYSWLAMSLGRKGEGGTIVLKEILVRLLKSGRKVAFIGVLSFLGVSLLLGDGVITPAISILSAVEGMLLIPGLETMHRDTIILIAAIIAIALFIFQYKGTDKVAGAFGPLMVIWFTALTLSGLVSIFTMPEILKAISPHYGFIFLKDHGMSGFFVLSEVILCATGGEALYADMGHLGRRPIIRAWYFVFVALVLNYLGQGAFVINHPKATNLLFGMVQWQTKFLYIPFLILTIIATVIASQALISGVFSIVYQGITTRIMPLMKVDYTSSKLKSQIYIGSVNWSLMIAVIFIMLIFKESGNLAAAYGLAVTGTMFITGMFLAAGSIQAAVGHRDLNGLGGLARTMPVTAFAFVIGAAAISGLPPLNGFASEWLTFQGLLGAGAATALSPLARSAALLAIGGLGLTAALAVACFVKATGVGFLALPRSPGAAAARETSRWMGAAMVGLALACVAVGLVAGPVSGEIAGIAGEVVGTAPLGLADPVAAVGPGLGGATYAAAWLGALLVALTATTWFVGVRRRPVRRAPTWTCGIVPEPAFQYTATSYAKLIRLYFGRILRPAREVTVELHPGTPFPRTVRYRGEARHVIDERLYQPIHRAAVGVAQLALRLQNGSLQLYLAYSVIAVLVMLVLAR